MFDNIKGILIVIGVCYFFVCLTKGMKIYQTVNPRNDSSTMLETLKSLSFEEFSTLTISFLGEKGFESFDTVDKGILKCKKNDKEFLIFNNNEINFLDISDGKIFYGYMLTHNIKGVILFTTGEVKKDIIDFFSGLKDISFFYYDGKELLKDYKKIVLDI